ncbi:MAG: hypothetical protein ACLRQ8_10075, partial [Coprococcus sp.]
TLRYFQFSTSTLFIIQEALFNNKSAVLPTALLLFLIIPLPLTATNISLILLVRFLIIRFLSINS